VQVSDTATFRDSGNFMPDGQHILPRLCLTRHFLPIAQCKNSIIALQNFVIPCRIESLTQDTWPIV